jgi:hypothetical protein
MCTCEVNRRAYVCTYGLNSCALGARLTGEKLIFLMFFMVNMADLGLFYVVVGDHFERCHSDGESGIGPS